VLPREPEAHLQDEDPSLAIYNDSDMIAVEVLRRGGVRADYLTEHRKVVSQFAAVEWDRLRSCRRGRRQCRRRDWHRQLPGGTYPQGTSVRI
jgi:hypothetical protein